MVKRPEALNDATPFIPETKSLKKLAAAVEDCRGLLVADLKLAKRHLK